jgi:hypothetical protein
MMKRGTLRSTGVELVEEPVAEFEPKPRASGPARAGRPDRASRSRLPDTRVQVRVELATGLGAEHDEDGMWTVHDHQHTSVTGLSAVGDMVPG